MKKYLWIKSTFLFSSLCCYSQFSYASTLTVSNTADSGVGSLRNAISSASSGDTIVFNFSPPNLNTITLTTPLPPLNSVTIGNLAGASANINGGGNFVFFAQSGNVNINNIQVFNAASIGGPGGSCGATAYGGAGGGGGLGAGGGLFVNNEANVVITDVTFHSNSAIGGVGGSGFAQPFFFSMGAGGGGGGALYGANAAGGQGGTGGIRGTPTPSAGGGGGGGGGNSPGALGLDGIPGTALGGTGGLGGGPGGGVGGAGGAIASGSIGQMGAQLFSGGGGGGGGGESGAVIGLGGFGGQGADFGGGGGAGSSYNLSLTAAGGTGGFGGGGGAGGEDEAGQFGNNSGGIGGFGGGGGGRNGGSLYGGGIGGQYTPVGGGGGAGLGGAIFVRNGGTLVINYSSNAINPTAISGNTAIGGVGGDGLIYEAGLSQGEDIFLNSGGNLTFVTNVPLTILTNIDSDPLTIGPPLIVQGSSILTLLGNNTFNGGVTINTGGNLAVQSASALGVPTPGTFLTLDEGTLTLIAPGFSWPNTVHISNGGGIFSVTAAAGATFSGSITGTTPSSNGGVTISGSGTTIFSGVNGYVGPTIVGPSATLQILSPNSLPSQGAVMLQGGILDFASFQGILSNSISGTGTIQLQPGSFPILSGTNTYSGNTLISSGATLGILNASSISPFTTITDNGALVFQNTTGTCLPGLILGTGFVEMDGTGGNLNLTGTNTYSGGTYFNSGTVEINGASALGISGLQFNGGVLELLNPFVGPINATATLNSPGGGTIDTDFGVVALYNGQITGAGAFACGGSGTLILSAVNNYTSTTLVDHDATLELTSILSLPSSSLVTDNGNLVFNLTATSSTIQNLIGGSGVVTLTGPNEFSLQQSANSYAGGTILNTGTLLVGTTNTFTSLGGGPLVITSGGTLEVTSGNPISTDKTLIIGPGGGNIQLDAGVTASFSSSIIDASGATLSIEGLGQMTFSGSDYSTGITILGNGAVGNGNLTLTNGSFTGPFTVSTGAVLGGYGTVGTLTNDGSVFPDLFNALNVTGDYTQSSLATFQVEITAGGNNSLLNVSQTASLDGTLDVIASPGTYLFGTNYTILTAGNPLSPLSSFSPVTLPTSPELLLTYNRDPNVMLTVISGSTLDSAHVHEHNPQQVLKNLQEIIYTPNIDLVTVIEAMEGLNTDQLTAALDQLHPAPFGAFDLLNANTNSQLTSIFSRHTGETCCLHLNQNCGCSNTSLWVQPFGYLYDQKRIGEQFGFHAMAKGVATGLNFCSISGLLIGLGGAYSSTDLHWNHHHGHGSMDKASIAIYSDYATNRFSVEMSVVGSLDIFTASRHIHFSTIDRHARHQKRGYDLTGHMGIGGDIQIESLFLRPFVNLDYLYLYQKGFTEGGAHSLDLSVRGYRSNMLRSEAGLSLTRSFHMGKKGCFAPTIWVSGINEAYLLKRHYNSTFIGETTTFEVRTFSNPLYLISPGIDLSWMFSCGLNLSLRYSAELNHEITTQKMDTRLEWFF